MILMTHMPKCGGTSFREGLIQTYGDGLKLYTDTPINTAWHRQLRHEAFKLFRVFKKPRIEKGTEIIYGHYCFDNFSYLKNRVSLQYGMFFREPVEWVGSYLFYMQGKHPNLYDGDVLKGIKKFDLHKGFSSFLGKVPVERLDFIGITEDYKTSLKLFQKIFGREVIEFHSNKTVNAPKSYRDYFLQKGILKEVENLMAENTDIFQRSLHRYQALCEQYDLEPLDTNIFPRR